MVKALTFGGDHWLEDSPLIRKGNPNTTHLINQNAKVSDFILVQTNGELPFSFNFFQSILLKSRSYSYPSDKHGRQNSMEIYYRWQFLC